MYALEVLQSFPSQRKALLSAIDGIDLANSSLLTFDIENFSLDFRTRFPLLYKSASTTSIFTEPLWIKVPLPTLFHLLAGKPSALQPSLHLPMPLRHSMEGNQNPWVFLRVYRSHYKVRLSTSKWKWLMPNSTTIFFLVAAGPTP